jgi:hypothetical protein
VAAQGGHGGWRCGARVDGDMIHDFWCEMAAGWTIIEYGRRVGLTLSELT